MCVPHGVPAEAPQGGHRAGLLACGPHPAAEEPEPQFVAPIPAMSLQPPGRQQLLPHFTPCSEPPALRPDLQLVPLGMALCPPHLVLAWDATAGSSITLEIADPSVQMCELMSRLIQQSLLPWLADLPSSTALQPPRNREFMAGQAARCCDRSCGDSEVQHWVSPVPAWCWVGRCPHTACAQGSPAQPRVQCHGAAAAWGAPCNRTSPGL